MCYFSPMSETTNTKTNQPQTGTEIMVAGITYIVEEIQTVEHHRNAGRVNLAAAMENANASADMVGRRPNGKQLHLFNVYNNGAIHHVVSI